MAIGCFWHGCKGSKIYINRQTHLSVKLPVFAINRVISK